MILAISGTPGTGKTTIAKLLVKEGWHFIDLEKMTREKNCYCGYDEERKCKIVDVDKLAKKIPKKKKGNLVFESHYAHDLPADFVIILRTNPKELRKRLENKGWSKKKIEENVEAEIMEVCLSEARENDKKIFVIDTTKKRPEKVVKEIIEIFED